MQILPPQIRLSASAVLGMNFNAADRFSARDMSYALAVVYLAQQGQPEDAANDIYLIPDNRLRAAMGLTRRDSPATDDARYIRLRDSTVRIGDGPGYPLPTVMFRDRSGKSMPNRNNMDDLLSWVIAPGIVEAFRPKSATDVVSIPLKLLQNAGLRWGIEIALKMLAMHALAPTLPGTIKADDEYFTRKMPIAALMRMFGQGGTMPSVFEAKFLKPAVEQAWEACDLSLDFELKRSGTNRNPKGRVKDVVVFLGRPVPSRIEAMTETERVGGWQTPPKTKRAPKPVVPSNVVAFAGVKRPIFNRTPIDPTAEQPGDGMKF